MSDCKIYLHPETKKAIDYEMAKVAPYERQIATMERREERLLFDLAEKDKTIGYLVECLKEAAKACVHPGSIQAQAIERGIRRVEPDWRPRKRAGT